MPPTADALLALLPYVAAEDFQGAGRFEAGARAAAAPAAAVAGSQLLLFHFAGHEHPAQEGAELDRGDGEGSRTGDALELVPSPVAGTVSQVPDGEGRGSDLLALPSGVGEESFGALLPKAGHR